jgi:hypothetical protein
MKRPIVGEVFSHWYPSCNKMGIPLEWVRRETLVTEIRDYSAKAITPEFFLERPLLRRGSTLIYGTDVLLNEPRKFYLEATPDYYLPTLRLGLFSPDETLVDWIGKEYQATRKDRAKMFEDVKKRMAWLAKRPKLNLQLGIYRGEAA